MTDEELDAIEAQIPDDNNWPAYPMRLLVAEVRRLRATVSELKRMGQTEGSAAQTEVRY